jgi:adenylate kinase family enzyme
VGNSGSGKTSLAAALAERLKAPHIELDAIYHQQNWQPLSADEFQARVADLVKGQTWVIDGNYSLVREHVWRHADTVVWLDLPRHIVLWQLLSRTIRRAAFRVELWNGNRERWRNLFARDPANSIILWAWTMHSTYRNRYATAVIDPRWADLDFHRIRSRADMTRLLRNSDHPA